MPPWTVTNVHYKETRPFPSGATECNLASWPVMMGLFLPFHALARHLTPLGHHNEARPSPSLAPLYHLAPLAFPPVGRDYGTFCVRIALFHAL